MRVSPAKLSPEQAKALDAVQKELAGLAAREQKNVAQADNLSHELAEMAAQAGKQPLIPWQIAEEMQTLQQLFQQRAVPSLENLAGKFAQGADRKQAGADLNNLQQASERVQKELEGLQIAHAGTEQGRGQTAR